MSETLRIYEIEGHGFCFEAVDDGKFLGTFERVEVYRHKAWNDASDALGYDAEYVPPGLVIEAGDEYRRPILGQRFCAEEVEPA